MVRVDLSGGVTSPDPHIDRPNSAFTSYTTHLHRQYTRAALTSARLSAPSPTVIQYSQDRTIRAIMPPPRDGLSKPPSSCNFLACGLPLNVGVSDATQACRSGLELGYAARLASFCRRPHDMQAPGAWQGSGATLRDPNRWVPRPPTTTVTPRLCLDKWMKCMQRG